jgi:hypothetical protein
MQARSAAFPPGDLRDAAEAITYRSVPGASAGDARPDAKMDPIYPCQPHDRTTIMAQWNNKKTI